MIFQLQCSLMVLILLFLRISHRNASCIHAHFMLLFNEKSMALMLDCMVQAIDMVA